MRIILLFLLLTLTGCYTKRAAQRDIDKIKDKYPEMLEPYRGDSTFSYRDTCIVPMQSLGFNFNIRSFLEMKVGEKIVIENVTYERVNDSDFNGTMYVPPDTILGPIRYITIPGNGVVSKPTDLQVFLMYSGKAFWILVGVFLLYVSFRKKK
jgi:hypothetical protein